MTAEQLEASRAERMRQNGHGAITIEDVRTWIEETGLCIFLPRSAQAGFTAPTFVEAIAGQRTTEPAPELTATAESMLVRLEAEGVAVRLNLAGQPLSRSGDQPDYVVAGWVLPYIYALRGDRDWRRSPQLTGSRQVSPLAVQAAKQIDTGNQTAMQIRDALGREVTETAVLRALHELWKQLRIIPVVPEVGQSALWQPLRQRFQKAIAEGASTSQVTAISVLASIYLQAVVAASMEDVEMFLSPLTSRSKIREVVRGLAATRQVHTTTTGQSPLFYVAGTLPEFPVAPSFQISTTFPPYRGSSYLGLDHDLHTEDDVAEPAYRAPARFQSNRETRPTAHLNANPATHPDANADASQAANRAARPSDDRRSNLDLAASSPTPSMAAQDSFIDDFALPTMKSLDTASPLAETPLTDRQKPLVDRAHRNKRPVVASAPAASVSASKPSTPPRPRTPRTSSPSRNVGRTANPAPRDRSRNASNSDSRGAAAADRRRAPAPRSGASNSPVSRNNGSSRPASGSRTAVPAGNSTRNGFAKPNGSNHSSGNGAKSQAAPSKLGNGHNNGGHKNSHRNGSAANGSHPNGASAKTGSHNGASSGNGASHKQNGNGHTKPSPNAKSAMKSAAKPSGAHAANGHLTNGGKPSSNARPAARHTLSATEQREPAKASAAKRYSFSGQAPKSMTKRSSVSSTHSVAHPPTRPAPSSAKRSTTAARPGQSTRSAKPAPSSQAKRRG